MEQCLDMSQQPLTQLLLWHRQGISKYLEMRSRVPPTPGTVTVVQKLEPCCGALGMVLTASEPTALKLSGERKPLAAVGFHLSPWLMALPLRESSYPTPVQAGSSVIFENLSSASPRLLVLLHNQRFGNNEHSSG